RRHAPTDGGGGIEGRDDDRHQGGSPLVLAHDVQVHRPPHAAAPARAGARSSFRRAAPSASTPSRAGTRRAAPTATPKSRNTSLYVAPPLTSSRLSPQMRATSD